MAPLSDQDREWVRAIISDAAREVLGEAKDHVDGKIRLHARECPHAIRGKAILFGMLLASSVGGGGAVYLLRSVGPLFKWLGG